MNIVYFKEDNIRREFFSTIKSSNSLKWNELITQVKIPKSTFWRYSNGNSGIPEDRFFILLGLLSKKEQERFTIGIIKKHSNWGQKIGGLITYKKHKEIFNIGRRKGLIKIRKIAKKKFFDLNIPLSLELCEVIGAFIGDGFVNKYNNKSYFIQFAGNKKLDKNYYNNKIIPCVSSIINKKPYIREEKEGDSFWITFYSKYLLLLLTKRFKFKCGKKAYTVRIPNEILKSDEKIINATIRGIFDTDGCIFLDKRKRYKKPYPRITLQIASKPLYLQLKGYLSKKFKLYAVKSKKRNVYCIEIYGLNQLKKWMSIIGFSNKRHLDRLPW